MTYRSDFLFYRVREDVEPGSLKDALIRNPHKCLDYKMVMDWRRKKYLFNIKMADMRRVVREHKNYKRNYGSKKIHNLNVNISVRDYMFPF